MNKLTKLLSVFVIAGAIGTGVAGVAGCTAKDSGHKHNYEYTQISGNSEKHNVHCTNDGHEGGDTQENHTWSGDECSKCGYAKPAEGSELVVDANVTGILIEGITSETVELSTTKTSHTIDKSAIKVYFATGNNADVKGGEVPAANVVLELTDSTGAAVSSWENITKDGVYKVNVRLTNATMASGAVATVDDLKSTVTITISNPIVAGSLAKTSTGDTTLAQGSADTISANWTFEVTLANGDKQPVAAADITVSGIDTMTAGTKKATVKFGEQTLQVEYTVTAVQGMVTQSYAVNFGQFENNSSITENMELNEAGGIYATGKSGGEVQINANSQSTATKAFTKRFQLRGSPVKSGNLDGEVIFRTIALSDVNKTTTEGATSVTRVTVYARDTSGGRQLQLYKEGKKTVEATETEAAKEVPTLTAVKNGDKLVQSNELVKNELTVWQFDITDTGTFHIASTSGGIDIYYIQVDKIITGEDGAENVPLGGESKATEMSLTTTGAKTVYKVNDTIDTSGITATVTLANEVTADKSTQTVANGDLTFDTSKVDNTKCGTYVITVTYGEGTNAVSKTYSVTVESEIDGVKGATATISLPTNNVESASDKITVKKGDVNVAAEWTNDAVDGVTVSYTVKSGDDVIDETSGKEFGVGTYTLTVEIVISKDGQTVTFTKEVELKISVMSTSPSWLYHNENSTIGESNPNIAKNATIADNTSFTAVALDAAKSGYNRDSTNFADKITDTSNLPVASANKTATGEAITFKNAVSFDTKADADTGYIKITAKKATTVYVYLNASDDKHGSNKAGTYFYYSVNGTVCAEGDRVTAANRKEVSVVKVTLAEGDELVIGANKGTQSSSTRIWLYGIEAVDAA